MQKYSQEGFSRLTYVEPKHQIEWFSMLDLDIMSILAISHMV